MGSSEAGAEGEGCGLVDWDVGTIVWVRRRNGSWWPGRILAPEELGPSAAMSPKTGTPVKLLGRDDASVDWYNLEKSKRVKAFRCGEFDECIEKVEATHSVSVKKREKYARREDAILHALELEKKQLETRNQSSRFASGGPASKPSNASTREKFNGVSSPGTSFKGEEYCSFDTISGGKPHVPITARKTPWSQREGPPHNAHHRYGSKSKKQKKDIHDTLHDHHVDGFVGPSSTDTEINCNGLDKNNVSDKRKKSLGNPTEESLVKKRDRRRPLLQVLKSSPKFSDPNAFQPDHHPGPLSIEADIDVGDYLQDPSLETMGDEETSGMNDKNEPDSVDGVNSETGTATNAVIDKDDEKHRVLLGNTHLSLRKSNNDESYRFDSNFQSLDDNETYSMQESDAEKPFDEAYNLSISKWHIKGKRNSRASSKRPLDMGDIWLGRCNNPMTASLLQGSDATFKTENVDLLHRAPPLAGETEVCVDSPAANWMAMDVGNPLEKGGFCGRARPSSSDSVAFNWHADKVPFTARQSYFEDMACYDNDDDGDDDDSIGCFENEMLPSLIDVDLKVQASYQGERVPLVSLMSRLNGKAIIGHPIQIDILEYGSTDQLISNYEASRIVSKGGPPVWTTSKRTAMQRVPRSNHATFEDNVYGNRQRPKLPSILSPQARLMKKSISQARRPVSTKHKKRPSEKSNSSSQKIRTLSSVGADRKVSVKSGDWKSSRYGGIFGELIKSQGAVPLVTCVPSKVVFSRILEAVGRPSLAVAQRVRNATPVV